MKLYVPGKAEEAFVKGLWYSNPGVGKTVLSAISQDALILNCEGGLLCLDKIKKYQPLLNYQAVDITSIADMLEIFLKIKNNDPEVANYKVIVIDSLIEISKISMKEILNDPKRDPSYDRLVPTLKDHQKNSNQVRDLVRAFRDLNKHVIFTCHAVDIKDEETGAVKVLPALSSKLAVDVMGYVDVVGYLFVDPTTAERKILFQPKGRFSAKDRSGKLGDGMVEPTAYEMIAKITGETVPDYVFEAKKQLKKPFEEENTETQE